MSYVIGIDVGTTSTIGILIKLPDLTLALESRPVDLRSPYPGWAEEYPEQWWRNVCEITRALIANSGVAAGDVAAIGVAGMLPAIVLLDEHDWLLRPSIQQSDGRCVAEVEEFRAEIDDRAFAQLAGNGINQQLLAAKTGKKTALTPIYDLMLAREAGDWSLVTKLGKQLNVSLSFVAESSNSAMQWAHEITSTARNSAQK